MNMLAGLSSQLDAVTNQLYRAQQDKAYQESMLAQQLSAWQMSQKSGEPREDTLEKQLADSQAQLVAMEAHYTASHPDVVKLKEDIAALKRKIEGNAARANDRTAQGQEPAGGTEAPEIQKLRFQIHQTEILIRERTRDQARLKEQLGVYQARLSMSPAVEQQYKELTRDYQTALQFYSELLAKKSQSEMATSLERRQQGEQFRVMDPPNLPEKPSFPNRPLFAGGGLGVGLALGIGITLLLEFRDKSLRTEDDVERFLGLPTLAMVPLINDRKGDKKPAARPADTRKAKLGQSVHA
jgi:uncharacterized protein involved in exopolysaccharide biosynthesis